MARVLLVLHHERVEAVTEAVEIALWLEGKGHDVRATSDDSRRMGREELGHPEEGLGVGVDVAVSLGGDGTMLRTVDLVAVEGVPVIGVNHGQLGYLTEVQPTEVFSSLERFFEGDYSIESRMMLAVDIRAPSGAVAEVRTWALNEAVLEKTHAGRTVKLDVHMHGRRFTQYAADGLIVATPTGSTAYAFSARGPIVEPTHRAVLLTPVSPHMLFDRTLVLDPATEVRVEVAADRPATLTVDGRVLGELAQHDAIVCRAADRDARLVTFAPRDFQRIVKAKFGLSER